MSPRDAKPKTSAKAKPKPKPKAKSKRGPGRPKVVIDWSTVEALLKAHCTGAEIAAHLGIADETLYRACERDNKVGFDAYSRQKKDAGNLLLKKRMMDSAMKGDRAMQMFLSKNWLRYSDKPKDESEESSNGPKNTTFTIIEELIEAKEDGTENEKNGDGDQLQGEPES